MFISFMCPNYKLHFPEKTACQNINMYIEYNIFLDNLHRFCLTGFLFCVCLNRINEELHILYSSPNIIRKIKSRRMRWAGHVARIGEERNVYKVLMGKPEGKNHLEGQGVYGRMGSEWILGRVAGGV
jgi:hypothetical protein